MNSIETIKANRFRFLELLYNKTEGDESQILNMFELGQEIGIDRDGTNKIGQYLSGEGLIKHVTIGGGIGITHYGVVEVEGALSAPTKSTQYFPPVNIIHVQNMENSQIQQGSNSSTQTMTVDRSQVNDLEGFVKLCREKLPEINLSDDDQSEIESDLSTLESQMSSSRPKQGIIKESLGSIKRILEGATGSIAAHQVITALPALLASI